MIRFGKTALIAALVAMTGLAFAADAQAQRRGFGRGINALTLLRAEAVQKELKLGDSQVAQVKEIVDKSRSESRELFQPAFPI